MSFIKFFIDVILILILQIFVHDVAFGESDDVYYVAQFNDKITECEDFDNKVFVCENLDISFVTGDEGADDGYELCGELNLKEGITDDYSIELMIYKDTPVGREFMYSIGGNLCESLKKQDTPWYPIVKALNRTECPIEPATFKLDNLVISLNFAKDVLTHEYCGDYIVQLEFKTSTKKTLSCYNVPLEIVEKTS